MFEAVIAGLFALVGAFGGALLGRRWKSKDALVAARREWAEEVLSGTLQQTIAEVATTLSVSSRRPVPPAALQLTDPSALAIGQWLARRIQRVQYALIEVQRDRPDDIATVRDDAFAYHQDTIDRFGAWARGDMPFARRRVLWESARVFRRPLRTARERQRDNRAIRPGVPQP
ncbi:hypothetical protein [uncultured Leifsonia sp.]|uniref:hypothetical protein n=1 Tax=uncultured Leifsonia sp. TaxID=340359 RepID=UPI0025DE914E|nr:hypothetical protein [uncultured Leifsonia sp.]